MASARFQTWARFTEVELRKKRERKKREEKERGKRERKKKEEKMSGSPWNPETNTVFTLHKLNRSNRSTTFLGATVNAFLPFRSVPLKNGTVKFAV